MRLPALPDRYVPVSPLRPDGRLWRVADREAGGEAICRLLDPPAGDPAAGMRRRYALWTAARVAHPALAGVRDHGFRPDGSAWVIGPWVAAPRLAAAGPLGPAAAGRLLADLLGALDALHRHGLFHGALDARRVRVAPDGAAVVMDLGLAAAALAGVAAMTGRPAPDPSADLRAAGALVRAALEGDLPAREAAVLARLLVAEPAAGFASAGEALAALGLAAPADEAARPAAPLVGREAALAELEAAWVRARDEGPVVAWLTGPAGAGKRRLLDAFAARAEAAGVVVARGAADGPKAPYGPIVGAVGGVLPALREHAPDALARYAAVLGRVLPGLAAAGRPPAADAAALAPEAARLRLQGALADVVAALACGPGLVLAIEGWERLDALSVEALARIRRGARGTALLLVVAAEGAPAGPAGAEAGTPSAPATLPAWAADAERIALGPLPPGAIGRLAAAWLGQAEPPAGLAERLVAAGGGLPGPAEGELRALLAAGTLRRAADGWALAAGAPAAGDTLAGLPPDAARLTRVAALLGGTADLDVLAQVAGLPEPAFFAGLDALRRTGLLGLGPDGAPRLAAPAMAAGAQALARMAEADRLAWHGAAARAYHMRPGAADAATAPLATAVAIARHAARAGEPDLGTAFALEAGRRLVALHALDEAVPLLEAGLDQLRREGRLGWVDRRMGLTEALADAHRLAGALPEARAGYLAAAELAALLADDRAHGRILGSLAKAHQVLDDLPAAAAACEASLAHAAAAGDADGQARAQLTAARLRVYAGQPAEARALAAQALDQARLGGDPARVAEALALLGYLLADVPAERAEGMERLEEAIAVLTGIGDPIGLVMATTMLGDAQAAAGDLPAARRSYRLARWVLQEDGVRAEEGITAINLGLVALQLGEAAEAAAMAAEARAFAEATGHGFQLALADGVAAVAAGLAGDGRAASAQAAAALAGAAALGNPYLDALVRPLAAEARLAVDDPAGAAAALAAAAGEEPPATAARRLALVAIARARLGDAAAASQAAEAAIAAADAAAAPVERIRARVARAEAALAAGDPAAAFADAEAAGAEATRLGLAPRVAEAAALVARAAAAGGAPEDPWVTSEVPSGSPGSQSGHLPAQPSG